jgi:hypothetical protein
MSGRVDFFLVYGSGITGTKPELPRNSDGVSGGCPGNTVNIKNCGISLIVKKLVILVVSEKISPVTIF